MTSFGSKNIILAFAFAFASRTIRSTTAAAEQYDVIIVGAGWAGLGAAKTLYENGVSNFVVLEAHDYIGGRCKSAVMYDDVVYETGTAYLTGIEDNLVFDLVKSYDTDYVDHEYKYEVYRAGKRFPDNGGTIFWNYYQGIWDAWSNQWYANELDFNSSLADVVKTYATTLDMNSLDADEKALFKAAKERASYDYAAYLSKFAVYAGNSNEDGKGGIAVAKRGLSELVNLYAEPLLPYVKLSSIVTKIEYYGSPAVITYLDESGTEVSIEGTNVLVTVPFGILKAADIEFVPSFVEEGEKGRKKQKAIDIMNPGKYEKIALFWQNMSEDEIFWDINVPHAMHVQENDSDQQGNFTHWNNYYHVNKVTMLESSASEQFVDAIEKLPDEVVVAQAVERLRLYYGADAVPDPTHYYLPRWYAEPFTKTIYAYAEPGAGFETRDDLRETLNGRLFFAGESTYEQRFGSVHGALKSGLLAVDRMYPDGKFPSSSGSPTESPLKSESTSRSGSPTDRRSACVSFGFGLGLCLTLLFSLV